MFILQEHPIDIQKIKDSNTNNLFGALVSFEGLVRADHKNGFDVKALLYIADTSQCIFEGEKIMSDVKSQFPISQAVCYQRFGHVPVGEPAIWIGVWSEHRAHCFNACDYIIENVKKRLVIWKKEIFNNGSSQWIYGEQTPVIT